MKQRCPLRYQYDNLRNSEIKEVSQLISITIFKTKRMKIGEAMISEKIENQCLSQTEQNEHWRSTDISETLKGELIEFSFQK